MKRLLLSILSLGIVSVVAIGATRAFFSDTDEILGNSIETSVLDITLDDRSDSAYFGLSFPVTLAPGENTDWITPNNIVKNQRFELHVEDGSMIPDHYELKFTTTDFVDGFDSGFGSTSNKSQYTKMVEVTSLYAHTVTNSNVWSWNGLTSQVGDYDGDASFVSLYDLERSIIDEIPVGEAYTSIGFQLTMSPDAGNKFQGDEIKLNIEAGAAQVAGQSVL